MVGAYLALGGAFAVGGMARSLLSSPHFYQFMTPASVGYTAGGLGTSSPNHIEWNEKSARAGAFLGFGLQAAAGAGILGFELITSKAFETFMAKEIVTIMGQEVLVSHGFALGGVGLNLAMDDINGMAYSSLGLIFPNILYFQVPIPLLVSLGKGIMRSYNGML